ncbi:DUF1819 family protein [Salimicrobium halophilum]|uniref:Putative inner membrane protein n=1 Tax=Salimicrobium halophilum TaxID=86666 RepID=A0A1G8WHZ5_9BACI|nr:DUF1819 family protein [Salimicrobium halophilum]SDJ77949.1 Putative inner membrane protein [Salimicrobium halophilum]
MVKKQKYKSTIKSRPFLYIETKKLSELLIQGMNEVELKNKVINENIFQVRSEDRKCEIASTILTRLNAVDDYLIEKIVQSDIETSKLIVLYAIMKTDRLFCEFMNEVFSEKIALLDLKLIDRDFNLFFVGKKEQSETVANWRDYTFYKLKQVYIRILCEAGLLKKQKGEREIIQPMLDIEVKEHVHKIGDNHFIENMVGV